MTRSIIMEADRPVITPRRKFFSPPSLGRGDTYKEETEKIWLPKKDLHQVKRLPSFGHQITV